MIFHFKIHLKQQSFIQFISFICLSSKVVFTPSLDDLTTAEVGEKARASCWVILVNSSTDIFSVALGACDIAHLTY